LSSTKISSAKEHHKALFAADLVCQEELKKGNFVYSLLIGDRHSQVLSRYLGELGAARDGSASKSSGEIKCRYRESLSLRIGCELERGVPCQGSRSRRPAWACHVAIEPNLYMAPCRLGRVMAKI
jgi:hypothetical protein